MSRVADSTITGFLYQFSVTLEHLLKSNVNDEVFIEGKIEDIDIDNGEGIKAIQCKYHESEEGYTLGKVYKPILQMLKTYMENENQPSPNEIDYILYAHFPRMETLKSIDLKVEDIETILNTENTDYICTYVAHLKKCNDPDILLLISKQKKSKLDKESIAEYFLTNDLELKIDIEKFLSNHFKFIVGKSFVKQQEIVTELMKEEMESFSKEDIQDIFYPNAIQKIAEISTKNDDERKVFKSVFLEELSSIKKTALTRWTKELKSYNDLLTARRNQLKNLLNTNYRKRCFVFESKEIENFNDDIVMFIKDYLSKYCCKIKLHSPLTIYILDYNKEQFDELQIRLFQKGIKVHTGYVGDRFFKEKFMEEPQKNYKSGWIEFNLRISINEPDAFLALEDNKPDDLFLSPKKRPNLDYSDINVEEVFVNKIRDLKYILQLEGEIR